MPTLITHAIAGGLIAAKAARSKTVEAGSPRPSLPALISLTALLSILPDFDYLSVLLKIEYTSFWGHRGFTHSLFFAAAASTLFTLWLSRRRAYAAFGKLRLFLLFLIPALLHPLLDAMTDGGAGVALFSPFNDQRYFLPYRPILVAPLGIGSYLLSLRFLLVLLNEFLVVVLPLLALLYAPDLLRRARASLGFAGLLLAALAAWASTILVFNSFFPLRNLTTVFRASDRDIIELYGNQYTYNPIGRIPTLGIPGGQRVSSLEEFTRDSLFDRRLEARDLTMHWASGFFPAWYGGVAGRWQDPPHSLLLRTFLGFSVPSVNQTIEFLKDTLRHEESARLLYRFSPAEKYDLAGGDYQFTATRSILSGTHNADSFPHYWYGICNGMALASQKYEEPHRIVEVINPHGFPIRFHPNDVKALLGLSLYKSKWFSEIGSQCYGNDPDSTKFCRLNAGVFLLAVFNRIGLAQDSFIVNLHPNVRKQFYLLDAARVTRLGPVYAPEQDEKRWVAPPSVHRLLDVRFDLELVSTNEPPALADRPDPAKADGTFYHKVGRRIRTTALHATIALNQKMQVIGGAWTGNEAEGPDILGFFSEEPLLAENRNLYINKAFNWPVIKGIYEMSIDLRPRLAPLEYVPPDHLK